MSDVSLKWKHENYLYPIVRIYSKKSAGSGTIIFSSQDTKNQDEYLTFVLTNHHVIADCIDYKKEWNSVLKRQTENEILEKPSVEVFSYVRLSEVDSSNRFSADIVAYDKHHDLALLKVDSPRKFDSVSKIIPKDKIRDIKLFMDVVVGGCSLAHEPFCSFGQVTFLKEIIEQKKYLMVSASSVFGNSGGALFLKETGELIGVPYRISAIQLGFGVDIITWMGFAAHPERIHEFLEEQEMKFIIDSSDDYYTALKRRERKQKEALAVMKAEVLRMEEESESSRSGGEVT